MEYVTPDGHLSRDKGRDGKVRIVQHPPMISRITQAKLSVAGCLTVYAATFWPQMAFSSVSEGVAFGVDNYPSNCAGSGLNYARQCAQAFVDELDDLGFDQTEVWKDAAVDGRDFMDAKDDHVEPYGTDWADIALYYGHGFHQCSGGTYKSFITMGDNGDGCFPSTVPGNALSMRFGEGGSGEELDVLFLFACRGVQLCVFEAGGYDGLGQYHPTTNADPFRVLIGFHGDAYDHSSNKNRIDRYVRASEVIGLGDHWIEEMYRNNVIGSYDQCPSVAIWDDNANGVLSQHVLSGLLNLRSISGGPNFPGFISVDDCDPNNGEPL